MSRIVNLVLLVVGIGMAGAGITTFHGNTDAFPFLGLGAGLIAVALVRDIWGQSRNSWRQSSRTKRSDSIDLLEQRVEGAGMSRIPERSAA